MTSRIEEMFGLSGRTALVTGASSGIGRAIAHALAEAGASVVLTARREDQLSAAVAKIAGAGRRAAALPCDLTDRRQIEALAVAVTGPFGQPDILVNAAGINLRQHADRVTPEGWDRTRALNLDAPFFLAQHLMGAMRRRGWGRVLNIASLQSVRAFENGIAYGATKGGLMQLTRAMAEAWSRHGITCNAIAPGFFRTELTEPLFRDPATIDRLAEQTMIGRVGALDDLFGIAVFLAGPASDYITGQTIFVDGGWSAR